MKEKVLDMFKDAGRLGGVLLAVSVASSLLLFHVWNQYQITHLGYEISRVTNEHRELLEENKKLSIEVAVQGRTERMAEVARARFGLQPVSPGQIKPVAIQTQKTPTEMAHAALDPR